MESRTKGRVFAVLLGGGTGSRLGADIPKQLLPLGGRPVFAWSLHAFSQCSVVDEIIVVSHPDFLEDIASIINQSSVDKPSRLVEGGHTRQQSVYNALISGHFEKNDILLFHDMARPFVDGRIIEECAAASAGNGAAGTYMPITDTPAIVKEGKVISAPPRDSLFCAQTPQGFRFELIKEAHESANSEGKAYTDDITMLIASGVKPAVVKGSPVNFKITTLTDYRLAQITAEELCNG